MRAALLFLLGMSACASGPPEEPEPTSAEWSEPPALEWSEPNSAGWSLPTRVEGPEPTDPADLYNLGVAYYRGETVERDVDRAAEYWRKAADKGHIKAHNSLAYMVYYGRGAPRDPQEGLRLWLYAAERGHAESQFHLASAYMVGREVDRDYVVAYAWASAAEFYAAEASDLGGGPKIHQDATALLGTVIRALPLRQTESARVRAREFIRLYGPKE